MARITYRALQKAVADLAKKVVTDADVILAHTTELATQAADTARIADGISALGVDPATVAETSHLARLMDGISDSNRAYMGASLDTYHAAKATHQQNKASHGGIAEAFNRSPVDASNLNREWLRQE
ncbi:hypothetical protein DBP19_36435 [Streptomyces sp. CS090A]|uniref:hypothetical protein n=1 Tax=Streptomyces sp. CS090A TaxID=2162710 RepID=UPI000D5060C4|nr:hypothetical protein [Streptomyces sp. CS090A]PVC80629.1 hypothetical protein DBP19_36435 [Streptomyces sp. CS090A]